MGSPVCGFRPTRALRCAFTKRPRPGTTNTPFFFVSLMAVSARCSRNDAAVLLLVSSFSARWRTSWVFVKPEAMNPPQWNSLFCCEGSYLTPRVLWKSSVLAAFYAVFTSGCPQNGTNHARSATYRLRNGPAKQVPRRSKNALRPPPFQPAGCHNGKGESLLSCAICEIRKEKRFCPAVHGRICPQCCGEQREVTLDCPSDCPYLQQAREHEKPRSGGEIDPSALFLQVEVPDQYLYEREHLSIG